MINIWYQYKYNNITDIMTKMQENSIIEYSIIAANIILTIIIIFYVLPQIKLKLKEKASDKEKKRKKDKLKYLSLQNEIQTEIEKKFADEDRKEIEERINQIEN